MPMKINIWSKACGGLLLLCLTFGGCASELPEENSQGNSQVFVLSEEDIWGCAAPDTVSGEILAPESEPADDAEGHTADQEAYSFLEEGSGYARADLSEAERIWYDEMEQILGGYQLQVELSEDGLAAGLTEGNIDRIFQCVLNDHPELFYVDGYSYTKYTRYGNDNEITSIEFSGRYGVDQETAVLHREQIREETDRILKGIDTDASEYDKVKYVYDTLIRETDYQLESPDNQNIYSVFVNHVSVCQGYAKATQYLLNRLGVECALVLGTVNTGEGHAWNLVNIDGSYYYVDTTWGDVSYQQEGDEAATLHIQPDINYDYLNVTSAELFRTHTISGDIVMPVCIDTAANYYVREGALFASYDREQMTLLFERMAGEGRNDVTIKCANADCYREVIEALIDRKEIFNYLSGMGSTVAFIQNDTQLSLTFWVTNE